MTMLGITRDTAKEHNLIRFPHPSDPVDLFFVENGQDIIVHDAYDNTNRRRKCEAYGDQMHFYCGGKIYHIQEYADLARMHGHTYEPAEPIQDITLFAQKILDRDFLDDDGKPIPYRVLWCNNGAFIHGEGWFERQMQQEDRLAICICHDADSNRQACLVNGLYQKEFMSVPDLIKRLNSISMERFERRQIEHSALTRALENKQQFINDLIACAKSRVITPTQESHAKSVEPER